MNLYETNASFDLHADRSAEREARQIAANREACLADCAAELAEHLANVHQAQATVDGLESQLAALAPERVEAEAREALRIATTAGDTEAATRAATTLQRLKAGLDETSVERLTVIAKLDACRADLASTRASMKKAEQAALKARLAAMEKDIARAVAGYQQIAQHAHERYMLLKEIGRQQLRYSAALANAPISVNYAAIERGPAQIELPAVFVPGHGTVRAVGKRAV